MFLCLTFTCHFTKMHTYKIIAGCMNVFFNPPKALNNYLWFTKGIPQKREFPFINSLEVIKHKLSFQNDKMGNQIKTTPEKSF